MHKIHNNSTNLSKDNLFCKAIKIHSHNTRSNSNNDYFISRMHTSQAQKSLSFSGPKLGNDIPTEIKTTKVSQIQKRTINKTTFEIYINLK